MRVLQRFVLAAVASAALAAGAAALLAPTPGLAAAPPGQENCTRPCPRWKVVNGYRCKFVGCDVDGVCRFRC